MPEIPHIARHKSRVTLQSCGRDPHIHFPVLELEPFHLLTPNNRRLVKIGNLNRCKESDGGGKAEVSPRQSVVVFCLPKLSVPSGQLLLHAHDRNRWLIRHEERHARA